MSRVSHHRHVLQAGALCKGESRVRAAPPGRAASAGDLREPRRSACSLCAGTQAAERDAAGLCAQAGTRTEATEEHNGGTALSVWWKPGAPLVLPWRCASSAVLGCAERTSRERSATPVAGLAGTPRSVLLCCRCAPSPWLRQHDPLLEHQETRAWQVWQERPGGGGEGAGATLTCRSQPRR
jgi:hypothetical protein